MNPSSRRKAARLGIQASELMLAAPQVVAHRLGRMARAGQRPSLQDQREFHRMGAEKFAAFGEAWQAMTLQWLKSNPQLATSMMCNFWPGSALRRGSTVAPLAQLAIQVAAQWQHATLDILGQGLRPVHRRAVANAKRLGRSGTR